MWSGGCEYRVSSTDYAPANLYYKIARGCKVSNGLGMCVFFLALTTVYAVVDLRVGIRRADKRDTEDGEGAISALLYDTESTTEIPETFRASGDEAL